MKNNIHRFLTWSLVFLLIFQQPLIAIQTPFESETQEQFVLDFCPLHALSQIELEKNILAVYSRSLEMGIEAESLPTALRLCAQFLINKEIVTHQDCRDAIHSYIDWLYNTITHINPQLLEDASSLSGDIKRGNKNCCCSIKTILNQILNLVMQMRTTANNSPFDPPCDTVYGILGDACTILGGNISQALLQIETCCEATLTNVETLSTLNTLTGLVQELNNTITTLNALTVEINETLTTIQALSVVLESTATTLTEIQNTLTTCCNNTTTQIADLKATITTDFQSTWTILGDVGVILGEGASIAGALLNITNEVNTLTACCDGTFTALADIKATIITDFQETWTILGDPGAILGKGATISGTLLSIFNNLGSTDVNGVFTVLGNVGTILGPNATISGTLLNIMTEVNALTDCCDSTSTSLTDIKATITTDFQNTWTILGDIGAILGQGATISGTLLNIMSEINTLTACCNSTITTLGDVGAALGRNATVASALSNLTQDANGNFTVLGNVGTILGAGATISGTLLSIFNNLAATTNNSTLTTLGDVGVILGRGATISGTLLNIMSEVNTLTACCNSTLTTLSALIQDANGTFTVLGNVGTILGPNATISGTLLSIFNNLAATTNNSTLTTLGDVGVILGRGATISGTLLNIMSEVNTLTACCNSTLTTLSTLIQDANGTFTVLGNVGTILGPNATISGTLLSIFNNLAATTNNSTLTTLGDVGVILGRGATISGTLLNIMSEVNTLTACCNSTLTTLSTLIQDANGTFTVLGNVGTILGANATISGTLLNIIQDDHGTFTVLGNVGTILGANATISGTLLNIMSEVNTLTVCCNSTLTTLSTLIQDANGTFTVLGNVGTILGAGATISGTLLSIFNNLAATTNNSTLTTLGDVGVILGRGATISGTLLNIMSEVNTLTVCCNSTLTTLSTLIQDANGTFTVLGNVGTILGPNATISGTLLNIMSEVNTLTVCCNSTLTTLSTLIQDANGTFTVLGNVGTILGAGATISGTLLNILSNTNSLTNCCAGTFSVLGNVGTILGANATISGTLLNLIQDANGTFSVLGNVGTILGAGATISGTLLNILSNTNSLTNCCAGTFSVLGNVGTILGANATISGTLLNIIQDDHGTFTVLGNVGTILGAGATISGTLLNILQNTNTLTNCCAGTFSVLGNPATLLGANSSISGTLFNIINTTTLLYVNACSPIVIPPSAVTVTTYTIAQPGRYILGGPIVFSPATAQPAFLITTSNVTLDLLCDTVSQGNATAGVNAVQTAPNLNNVTITNGTIQNFTNAGISISSGCSRATIENLTVFSCGARAIQLLGTTGAGNQITESQILNCNLTSCCQGATGDVVLTVSFCNDVTINGCLLDSNGNSANTLQGIRLNNCLKCTILNTQAKDNIAGTDLRDFALNNATLCQLKNCISNNSAAIAAGSNCRGFVMETGSTCTVNEFFDCSVLNLTGTAIVDGFLTDTSNNNNLFVRCEASFNTSLGIATGVVHGFNTINNSFNTFIDCIARGNDAPNSTAVPFGAYGFDLNTTSSCTIIRGLATDHSTGAGTSNVGINVNAGISNLIQDCQSARNGVGYNVNPNISTSHAFTRNLACKNTTPYSQFPSGSTQITNDMTGINGQLTGPWSNVAIG